MIKKEARAPARHPQPLPLQPSTAGGCGSGAAPRGRGLGYRNRQRKLAGGIQLEIHDQGDATALAVFEELQQVV